VSDSDLDGSNQFQEWVKYEMKRLRDVGSILLAAIAIAGCSVISGTQTAEVVPSASAVPLAMPAKSCIERSASTLPPKHPIVELAWCIAETDDLYDPDKLFRKTLKIDNYKIFKQDIGIRAFNLENSQQFKCLVDGVAGFEYTRTLPEEVDRPGNRYLSFNVDSKKACVKMSDVEATFGKDYWFSAVPIAVSNSAAKSMAMSALNKNSNPYGVSYKSPRLFMGDVNGAVNFDYEYKECIRSINIQRRLDSISYLKIQQEGEIKKTPVIALEWLSDKKQVWGV
jgi:hypothetical protein